MAKKFYWTRRACQVVTSSTTVASALSNSDKFSQIQEVDVEGLLRRTLDYAEKVRTELFHCCKINRDTCFLLFFLSIIKNSSFFLFFLVLFINFFYFFYFSIFSLNCSRTTHLNFPTIFWRFDYLSNFIFPCLYFQLAFRLFFLPLFLLLLSLLSSRLPSTLTHSLCNWRKTKLINYCHLIWSHGKLSFSMVTKWLINSLELVQWCFYLEKLD